MSSRTQEQVIDEIHRQRDELVSAMAETSRDVSSEIARLKRSVPIIGAVIGVLVVSLAVRRLTRSRQAPVAVERARIGRFSLLEHR